MIQDPMPRQQNKAPWPVITQDSVEREQLDGPRIKVMAKRMLYYEHLRRREGDVFYLSPKLVTMVDKKTTRPIVEKGQIKKKLFTAEEQFDPDIMERVDEAEPERITTSQQALDKAQDELNEAKLSRKR